MEITKNNYESEVKNSNIPVLLDFHAAWCGPCRMLAPVIEEIANEYAGEIKVGKINVDDEPELARRFGIMSIPTLVLIRDGVEVKKSVGFVPKSDIVEMIK